MIMTNDQNGRKRSLLERLSSLISNEPRDRAELIHVLRDAEQHHILDAEALSMIEGTLQVNELQARDIMIPRPQMIVFNKTDSMSELLPILLESKHSRYPVMDDDDVIGIFLVKDLLEHMLDEHHKFELRQILRPALFIPESKRLNVLLKEFRTTKNHMAIVIDEYGKVAGLVTMEDVLEQIIGEIEDETDIDEEAYVKKHEDGHYIIKAMMPMGEFNDYFEPALDDEDCDTIGGLLIKHFGHLPTPDERITIGNYDFSVVHADNRKIRMICLVKRDNPKTDD